MGLRSMNEDESLSQVRRGIIDIAENTNHHIHEQKKLHTCSYSDLGTLEKTRDTKTFIERLFTHNKEFKALTESRKISSKQHLRLNPVRIKPQYASDCLHDL